MLPPLTISRADLVAALGLAGRSERTVRARLARLHAAGLPRPLPGLDVWPRNLVEAWVASGGAAASPGAAPAPAAQGYARAACADLEARLAARDAA